MRVLSKREPFRYFQFPDPDPINRYLFLFLVYVRFFHHSWNCTFVFLFKVQGPFFTEKINKLTELSFNLYDLTKEFNPGKKKNVSITVVFFFIYMDTLIDICDKIFFFKEIYEKDFFKTTMSCLSFQLEIVP